MAEVQDGRGFEVKIGALSLLAGTIIWTLSGRDRLREEFIGFMVCRFNLTQSQVAWCVELLEFYNGDAHARDAENIIFSAGSLLSNDDLNLMSRILNWFQGIEIGGLVYEESVSDLFPPSVCRAFQILEISPTFLLRVVRSAFRKKITSSHPDHVSLVASEESQGMTIRILSARTEVFTYYQALREGGASHGED